MLNIQTTPNNLILAESSKLESSCGHRKAEKMSKNNL